jgi:hypothetical protein
MTKENIYRQFYFSFEKGSGTQLPKIRSARCDDGYNNAREKVPEIRSGFHPSEKELPEQRSGAFPYKNTPDLSLSHTHTHTHTHIYIYIYIVTCWVSLVT